MSEADKLRIEDLVDEAEFWQTYREVHRRKGIDIRAFYSGFAAKVEEGLTAEVRSEFRELCDAGCLREGVALLLELLRYSPAFQPVWAETVGQPQARAKRQESLERAAQTLEELFGSVLTIGSPAEAEAFAGLGRVPVSRLASELRTHARFIAFAERLSEDTETHSPVEFCKYVFTSYVKRMTGQFHDRCVSGLVGATVGPEDYAETAHSQWRFRNYARLDGHHSGIVKLLVAMSVVVAHDA